MSARTDTERMNFLILRTNGVRKIIGGWIVIHSNNKKIYDTPREAIDALIEVKDD